MVHVAIITEEDKIWSLYVWERTIPLLKKSGVYPVGLWICPPKFSRLKPNEDKWWYLKSFGIFTFLKLGIFAAIATVRPLHNPPKFVHLDPHRKNRNGWIYLLEIYELIHINYIII
jgi:hypothetical protein